MQKLENNNLSVTISEKGAELQNLVFKGQERLWQGNTEWWARRAPVLFPVVGKCNQNHIKVDNRYFAMGQHGFARDRTFEVKESTSAGIIFTLIGADDEVFPFSWQLDIRYQLSQNGLSCIYEVFNLGEKLMPYAIGAHPGFLVPNHQLSDALIQFDQEETFERQLLQHGLFSGQTDMLESIDNKKLPLSGALFDLDAIVLFNVKSAGIIWHHQQKPYLQMNWKNMPHLGIWTQKGCNEFLCIEPWAGHADFQDFDGEFSQKQGVHFCKPNEIKQHSWEIHFY